MRAWLAGFALLGLSACMVGPDYERPAIDLPTNFPNAGTEEAPLPPPDWWTLYGSQTLNRLVASGLERNADLRAAIARVEESEAVVREVAAGYFPRIDGEFGASRGRSAVPLQSDEASDAARPVRSTILRNTFTLTANTSFELDFWGRLRRTAEAARANYAASRYGREVVALTLTSSIARSYFAVLSLNAQSQAAEENLRATEESLEIVRLRAEAGLISDLDVNQGEAARAAAAAQLKELLRQRDVFAHLLGELTGVLDLPSPQGDIRDLPTPPLPPPGLPSALLERRPDVRQAEAELVSANALIGAARAEQFPTLTLTGAFGRQSAELSDLFNAGNRIWSVGLGIIGPIFDAGRYAARTDQAVARQKQAGAAYQRAVETAFREVADGLTNVQWNAAAEADQRERVERARSSVRLAGIRYRSGYSSYLEVLDAQRTLNEAELALIRNREAFLANTVDLMSALGGGWTPDPR